MASNLEVTANGDPSSFPTDQLITLKSQDTQYYSISIDNSDNSAQLYRLDEFTSLQVAGFEK